MQLAVLAGISPDCAENLKRGNLASFEYTSKIPEEVQSDVILQDLMLWKQKQNLRKQK